VKPSVRESWKRGAFHATVGLAVAIALAFLPRFAGLVALAAITAAFLFFDVARLYIPSLNRLFLRWFRPFVRPREGTGITSASYFIVACLIAALAFPWHIAVTAILFLALGDPAATVVGLWKGRIGMWGRTLEGHAACFIVCGLVAVVAASVWQDLTLPVAIVGAAAATLLQALPLPLNDNLTIPLGSAVVMRLVALVL